MYSIRRTKKSVINLRKEIKLKQLRDRGFNPIKLFGNLYFVANKGFSLKIIK